MQSKKSAKSNLENYNRLFMLLGLVLALLISYIAIEHKTMEDANDMVMAYTTNMQDDDEDIHEHCDIGEPPKLFGGSFRRFVIIC